jgi:hypothetical protein
MTSQAIRNPVRDHLITSPKPSGCVGHSAHLAPCASGEQTLNALAEAGSALSCELRLETDSGHWQTN